MTDRQRLDELSKKQLKLEELHSKAREMLDYLSAEIDATAEKRIEILDGMGK